MNTNNYRRIYATNIVLSTVGLSLFSRQVIAEELTNKDKLLSWLNNLPDWVPMLIIVLLFLGLSMLILLIFCRIQRRERFKPLVNYSAAAIGVLLGIIVGQHSITIWKAYIFEELNHLPATGFGEPSVPTIGAINLLDELNVEEASIEPKIPIKVLSGRVHHVKVNLNAINADTLELNLFGDTNFTAVRDRIIKNVKDGMVWVGHIIDNPESEVILAVKGKALMGTVEIGDRSFEIVYVGGATHAVRELDPNKIPDKYEPKDFAPDVNEGTTGGGDKTQTSNTTFSAPDTVNSGQIIDLLVAYTPKASANAGGVSGIEARILNAVTKANQAYLNSQANMTLNIVGMMQINYVETNDMTVSLTRLQSTADSYMDEIHTLRNQYAADQVTLVSADSNYCGYSNIMTTASVGFAPYAFSVVHDDSVYNCLGSNNTLAHELGHNQGNVHNIENTSIAGASPDAYGYRVCGAFRDIMAYSCSGEIRIPYFSNPNVYWNSQPTGILGSSNSVRSMNVTAPIVASFRTSATTVPNTPSSLSATLPTSDSIVLNWIDNATNEMGYFLQRSTDNITWNQVALLGQNAINFNNTGLSNGQTYYYRVYAYNSAGNSGFSNVASASTTMLQVDTTPPVVKITTSASIKANVNTQQINVTATDNVGVITLKLYIDNILTSYTNSSSLSYNWNIKKVSVGVHIITAQAIDLAGNISNASTTITK